MGMLVILHLLAVGLWIGCIAVEVAFERIIPKTEGPRAILAALHERVDLAIEVPAFLAVLATGMLMLPDVSLSVVLGAKLAVALMAVLMNVACVALVLQRRASCARGDATGFARADHRQHKLGAAVVLLVLVTLGLGLWHSAGGIAA